MPSSGGKEFSTRFMGQRQAAIYIHASSLKEEKRGIVKKRENQEGRQIFAHAQNKVTFCSIEIHFIGGPKFCFKLIH